MIIYLISYFQIYGVDPYGQYLDVEFYIATIPAAILGAIIIHYITKIYLDDDSEVNTEVLALAEKIIIEEAKK